MSDTSVFDQPLVIGLDIGTRNVVGTVGYKTENEFVVVAQYMLCLLYTSCGRQERHLFPRYCDV